jgi:hypothetical protein
MEQSASKTLLDSVDLEQLSDNELLSHLDKVSSELKRRNQLLSTSNLDTDPIRSIIDMAFSRVKSQ